MPFIATQDEEAQEEDKREYETLIAELQSTIAKRGKAIEDRDAQILALQAEAEKRSESREQLSLRAEIDLLRAELVAKEEEVKQVRWDEAEGPARVQVLQQAVRQAEAEATQRATEEQRRRDKLEAELTSKLEDTTANLDAARKRYGALSEKFAQREDVVVELRARMDEYERGVHGLREEVQEKEKMKALLELRSDEVKKLTKERNRREAELQELSREAEWLREHCGIQPGDVRYMDLSKLELRSQIEVKVLRSQVLQYEDELQALEKERALLLKKLRVSAKDRGMRAAAEGIAVEKLAALEELAAGLDTDPDFSDRQVAAARLRQAATPAAAAGVETAQLASLSNETSVHVLQQRVAALQAELASRTAALQEAESKRRQTEREKSSLKQDHSCLEDRLSTLLAQISEGVAPGDASSGAALTTSGARQAAVSHENVELRAALHDMVRLIRNVVEEAEGQLTEAASNGGSAGWRSSETAPKPVRGCATSVVGTACSGDSLNIPSASTKALSAALEQLYERLNSLRDLGAGSHCPGGSDGGSGAGRSHSLCGFDTGIIGGHGEAASPSLSAEQLDVPSRELRRTREARLASLGVAAVGLERSDVSIDGSVMLPDAFSEGTFASELEVEPYDLIAALNAQLLEAKLMHEGQQARLARADSEVRKYKEQMNNIQVQHTYLYATHWREVRMLQAELHKAEQAVAIWEAQHSEDVVKIESWLAMADALESTGDVRQHKVASCAANPDSILCPTP